MRPVPRPATASTPGKCPNGPHVKRGHPCITCEQLKGRNPTNVRTLDPDDPTPLDQYCPAYRSAIQNNEPSFTPTFLCPRCGTNAERDTETLECAGCATVEANISPRQRAKRDGESWYMPDTVCQRCGTQALKRVSNGECQGCSPPKRTDTRRTARAEARRCGETWYWPDGETCDRCGWYAMRNVQTGHCSGCRRATAAEHMLRGFDCPITEQHQLRIWRVDDTWFFDPRRKG